MALQIRRGLAVDLPASPADGELLYATDTNDLYIGNGGSAQPISGGTGVSNVVEDTSPQLGGDLDVNGKKIVSTGNGNIELDPGGTGNVILHGNFVIDNLGNVSKTGQLNFSPTGITSIGSNTALVDGNLFVTRNSYSSATGQGFTFAQHHETADAVNCTFYRTRGTGNIPTTVQNGDDLADLNFIGQTISQAAVAASISVTVDGVPSSTRVPGKITFATDNGSSQAIRAELSSAGIWKVNNIQNYSGSSLTLTATDIIMAGNTQLNAQSDLRFADADSSNYVAFQAPATVSTNITWTLPDTDGATGQVLTTNGGGALSWTTAGAGGSLASRSTVSGATGTLSNGSAADVDISGYKGYMLYTVQTSHAAWVRLYVDGASRTADASRLEGSDPLPGAGVIAEVITTGAQTIIIGVIGFNNESSPTTNIPITVTNKSGGSANITVSLSIVQLEA